jgi:hypothetical protein
MRNCDNFSDIIENLHMRNTPEPTDRVSRPCHLMARSHAYEASREMTAPGGPQLLYLCVISSPNRFEPEVTWTILRRTSPL